MKHTTLRLFQATLALIAVVAVNAAAQASALIEKYQTTYEKQLNGGSKSLDGKLKALESAVLRKYGQVLERLYDKTRKSGTDLDAIIAMKSEKIRLADEKVLTEAHISGHEKLAALQKPYIEYLEKAKKDHGLAYIELTDKYIRALNNLKSKLVTSDRLPEAIAVRELVTNVEAKMAVFEESLRPEKASFVTFEDPKPEARPVKTSSVKSMTKEAPEGAPYTFYKNLSEAPKTDGKRQSLSHTSQKSRAVSSKLMGTVYLQKIGSKSKSRSYSSKTVEKEQVVPRFELKVGREDLSNCTLIYDYYNKGSGNRRKKVFSERIPIGDLSAYHSLVVDAIGHQSKDKAYYKYDSSYYGSYKYSSYDNAGDYAGYVVSVFDGSDQMVFQRTSLSSLSKMARTSLKTN